ncbi:MAG: hypothetical protein HYY04_03690 [Chloroflexi bacterium]|nr:hypothetical protein [Chloroflexota bacterium]
MARRVKRLDLERERRPVREFLGRIYAEGIDVVVERAGRAMLAIVSPKNLERLVEAGRVPLTADEREERLRQLFGAWKDVDADAMKTYIYEGRTLDRRSQIEL